MDKFRKFIAISIVLSVFAVKFSTTIWAASYTADQVSQHGNSNDCWMIINQNVYDLTDYLSQHDRELDIRSWCGKNATVDYADKAGKGQSHSSRADTLLSKYFIGNLEAEKQIQNTTTQVNSKTVSNNIYSKPNEYNFFVPFLGTILAYVFSLKVLKRQVHNLIWNSVMLLGLIPSFLYGIIMVLGKQFPWIDNLRYNRMLYHHVELSIMFGVACVSHFLLRFKIYLAQTKNAIKK